MKNKLVTQLIIICLLMTIIPSESQSFSSSSLLDDPFTDYGYKATYEIIQGDSIDQVFPTYGLGIKGSLIGSSFNVLLKNKYYENREIYFIDAGRYINQNVTTFSIENYLTTTRQLTLILNTSSPLLGQLIHENYQAVSNKTISVAIPKGTSLPLPFLFSTITRPDFGKLLEEEIGLESLNFLPFILGKDKNRYEAEFASLALLDNMSVNILNDGHKQFSLAITYASEIFFSFRVTWDKQTGLMKTFSINFQYEDKESVLAFRFKEINRINKDISNENQSFFISNSFANYKHIIFNENMDNSLKNLKESINSINNTQGLLFEHKNNNGLELNYNQLFLQNKEYTKSSPISSTLLQYLLPWIIPTWDKWDGMLIFVQSLLGQLEHEMDPFQFLLTGPSTDTLFTLGDMSFDFELRMNNSIRYFLGEFNIWIQKNNTQTVFQRTHVQEFTYNISTWLAYSSTGELVGFSISAKQHISNYFDPLEYRWHYEYIFDYIIESSNNTISPPDKEIEHTEKTSFQLNFYLLLTICLILKKIKKHRRRIDAV